jgi:RND family efflux transporter MFP subunit
MIRPLVVAPPRVTPPRAARLGVAALRPAAVLAAVALAAAGCRRSEGTGPARPAAPAAEAARPAARLAAPEKVRFAPEILATGNLKARQSASLAFSVPGTLQRVAVVRGQSVAEGAPLAALDTDVARAAASQAKAGLEAARAQARLAQDAFERVSQIRKENGASEAQLVQVEAQRDLARAQALAAEAQLEQARVNLSKHALRAPFAGVVTRVPDGVGLAVGTGVSVITLESTRSLTLETSLTQEEAAAVKPGDRAEVWVPATGARTAEATVTAIVPSVDSATGRVPVEIAVPNGDGRFLAHAFARARLPSGAPRDAFRLPAAALVQRDGAYSVWIAGADGKARTLPVRVLGQEAESAVVDPGPAGWPASARVVDQPPLGIAEGATLAEAAP